MAASKEAQSSTEKSAANSEGQPINGRDERSGETNMSHSSRNIGERDE